MSDWVKERIKKQQRGTFASASKKELREVKDFALSQLGINPSDREMLLIYSTLKENPSSINEGFNWWFRNVFGNGNIASGKKKHKRQYNTNENTGYKHYGGFPFKVNNKMEDLAYQNRISLFSAQLVLTQKVSLKWARTYNQYINNQTFNSIDKITENKNMYNIDSKIAFDLYLGVSPMSISRGVLNGKEAFGWISYMMARGSELKPYHITPLEYLLKVNKIKIDINFELRNRTIIDWIIYHEKRKPGVMSMPIRYYSSDKEFSEITAPLNKLDEVSEAMLTNGMKTSLKKVMAVILDDYYLRFLCDEINIFPKYKKGFKDVPEVEQVLNSHDLVRYSNILQNCSAGYKNRCMDGDTYIFVIKKNNELSMFELCVDEKFGNFVRQHSGFANNAPIESHVNILNRWKKEIGIR
jgi:hypothetical protein